DVTAWCLLAAVVAVASSGSGRAVALTIALAAVFSSVMVLAVRPALARAARALPATDTGLQLGLLALAFLSGLCTELIGIHPLFGAFLAGAIAPPAPGLRSYLRERLGGFTTLFLLPLFFAFSGLRTRIGLLAGPEAWEACGLILLVAVTGKFAGCALAARLVGSSLPEAVSVGALMNTRGLMELVALNVGYDLGVVSAPVFAMLVLMALATTAMAGPVLSRVERWAPGTLRPEPAHLT
ncbi:MAG: cation:proton antiporter, partial [Elusimicrobia bacterium]|nr:cation:proton antiporter [Elusimicrobiota bacterium]